MTSLSLKYKTALENSKLPERTNIETQFPPRHDLGKAPTTWWIGDLVPSEGIWAPQEITEQ